MKYIITIMIISAICVGCSSPTEVDEDTISTITTTNSIIINSSANGTIYLFVVEQGIAAVINWAPGFGDPQLSPNGSIVIPFADIYNGKSDPVQSGDKIIINYWDRSDEENPKIFSKVVEL